MTDEERKAAIEASAQYWRLSEEVGDAVMYGYAAACEAKRNVDHLEDMLRLQDAERALDAERTRSAKLLDALKFMTMPLANRPHTVDSLLETISNDDLGAKMTDVQIRTELEHCKSAHITQVRVAGPEWVATLTELLHLRAEVKAANHQIAEQKQLIEQIYAAQNG